MVLVLIMLLWLLMLLVVDGGLVVDILELLVSCMITSRGFHKKKYGYHVEFFFKGSREGLTNRVWEYTFK